MQNILIIILGCSILNILQDRITSTISFVLDKQDIVNNDKVNIEWILTGGVKDPMFKNIKPEARIMYEEIIKYNITNSNYIFDLDSTNTAENFVFVSKYLKKQNLFNNKNYSEIYITTSEFHYERANLMLSQIIPNNNFTWILSPLDSENLIFWEKQHITNTQRDVEKALNNFRDEL